MKSAITLAFSFALRDFKERYIGTSLGQLWYILSPVITIFIYTVIFSDFMKMKLDLVDNSYSYSIYLVSGLLAWTSFSTIILRLNNSILERANFIKKISVPTFVYHLSIVMVEFGTLLLSYTLALIFLLLVDHPISLAFLFLVPVLVLQSIFAFGIGVIISLFTPFFKDLKEAVPIVVQLWFWMTPIIYLSQMVEAKYPYLLKYNPFYHFAHIYQDIFLYSKVPSLEALFNISIIAFIPLVLAAYLYKKMIGTIKDII